ncbi:MULTISPECIES: ABC transporter ATP-binding protein [unclassified Beijerinckia]|uniref:ABC transporter ATP-binding protein n=1 Tax=unclassified Beijerinckia TaxID=2638183 RepID=UPI0008979321|nr:MULTISPECIES: ABC transporter ATP-binding protein [unclassified Beijerinckia]MDH7798720.1 sulfonate transport system ATP-binding protein [Beijerinckia sp. GAS462]SED30770.1 sulfonate transport system ATP-binding protein [Beijerinckia sp. 28-YEA-48]
MPLDTTRDPIILHNVERAFDGRQILRDINLVIEDGEFVVLVGKSGCGKSTLLRIVGGLDSGAEGHVDVAPEHAICFQDPRLLPWKSVWRNVTLGLSGPGRHLRTRALGALAEVGLRERADAWPLTLSGGEAQRVALARALVRTPRLLLLDEPFAALDALTRLKMQQQILRLWRHHRIATLFVTHDVDEALLLADRILLMEAGSITREFRIDLDRPRKRDDADFALLRKQILLSLGVDEQDGG